MLMLPKCTDRYGRLVDLLGSCTDELTVVMKTFAETVQGQAR